jgi:hypothetical protein
MKLKAKAHWNPQPPVPADRREGRLQCRSRCGLKKSLIPSRLKGLCKVMSRLMRSFLSDCREAAVFSRLISGGNRSPELCEGNAEGAKLPRR